MIAAPVAELLHQLRNGIVNVDSLASGQVEKLLIHVLRSEYGQSCTVEDNTGKGGPIDVVVRCRHTTTPNSIQQATDFITVTYIECKHYKRKLDLDHVAKVFVVAVIDKPNELIIVSSSDLAPQARRCADYLFANKRTRDGKTAVLWCHEQYDAFGFKTNHGVAASFRGDWSTAYRRFQEAAHVMKNAPFPLLDPYFEFQSAHNLAVASAALGRFKEALTLLEEGRVPGNCYDYDVKVKRRENFLSAFREGRMPSAVDCPEAATRWPTRTCIMELATLQFFDFNVNVVPPAFLDGDGFA